MIPANQSRRSWFALFLMMALVGGATNLAMPGATYAQDNGGDAPAVAADNNADEGTETRQNYLGCGRWMLSVGRIFSSSWHCLSRWSRCW